MKISWITIYVKNMEESKRFYCDVIGLKIKTEMNPKPGLKICFLDGETIDYELIEDADHRDVKIGKSITVAFLVEALNKKIHDHKKKGVEKIVGPVQPAPNIRFVFIQDPNGMTIQIAEHL